MRLFRLIFGFIVGFGLAWVLIPIAIAVPLALWICKLAGVPGWLFPFAFLVALVWGAGTLRSILEELFFGH